MTNPDGGPAYDGTSQQPGTYPQQPSPYQQPGGYAQQPPQQGGYPRQGGYPQYGAYPQQGGYPQQPVQGYGAYPPAPPTNTLAIITIIAAFVFPIVGIITGHIALSQLRTSGEQGAGLAKAGLIISYVYSGIVVAIVLLSIIAPFFLLAIMAPMLGSIPTSP